METEITKKGIIEEALNYGRVLITVDTRMEGVDVPQKHMDQDRVPFSISYKYPYGELELGDTEITTQLSFNKKLYPCRFPYDAIKGIFDVQGNVHAFGPAGEYLMFQRQVVPIETAKEKAAAKGFRVIDGGKDDE